MLAPQKIIIKFKISRLHLGYVTSRGLYYKKKCKRTLLEVLNNDRQEGGAGQFFSNTSSGQISLVLR